MSLPRSERGLTLVEVSVAVAILGFALSAMMVVHSGSIQRVERTRDVMMATLLARSKMVDIELESFQDGFSNDIRTEEGTFEEEGHPQFKWSYTLSPLEMDLSALASLCAGEDAESEAVDACTEMIGQLTNVGLGSMIGKVNEAIRLVELEISWMERPTDEKPMTLSFKHLIPEEKS